MTKEEIYRSGFTGCRHGGMGRDNAVKKTLDVKGDLDYVGSEKKVYRTLEPNESTRAVNMRDTDTGQSERTS